MNSNPTQRERILKWLQSGRTLSPIEALDIMNCFRLAARIHELRKAGHRIETKWVKRRCYRNKKRSVYKLL